MTLRIFLLLIATVALSSCTGGIGTGPGNPSGGIDFDNLYKQWTNSREEQIGDGVVIYRAGGFENFPASRFRMSYIFRADRTCDWFYLEPADGHHFRPGTWVRDLREPDIIHIDQDGRTVSYRILELTRDILRMRSLP